MRTSLQRRAGESVVEPILRSVLHLYVLWLANAGLRCLALRGLDAVHLREPRARFLRRQLQPVHACVSRRLDVSNLLARQEPT